MNFVKQCVVLYVSMCVQYSMCEGCTVLCKGMCVVCVRMCVCVFF